MQKGLVNISRHNTVTIGIIGTCDGAGVTHMVLMIAVYLAFVKGYRIAIVEMNDSGNLRQAEIIRSSLDRAGYKYYKKKISILSKPEMNDISQLISDNYDYVIFDYGSDYGTNNKLFLLNNIKIVIGSLSWWKLQFYVSFFAKTENENSRRKWMFLGNNVYRKAKKYLEHTFKISIETIPYEPNPFELSQNTLLFLTKLMDGR